MPEETVARIKTLLKRHGDPLHLRDWYFEHCPEKDRRACFYYEYLREASRERRIRSVFWSAALNYDPFTDEYDAKKAKRWFAAQHSLGKKFQRPLYTQDWIQGLIRAPWPNQAWLDLPVEERKRRSERIPFVRIDFGKVRSGLSKDQLAWIAKDAVKAPQDVWGFVKFQKGATVEEVIKSFTTELREVARAHPEFFEVRDLGQTGWFPSLRALGARRLRNMKQYFKSRGEQFTDVDVIAYSKLKLDEIHEYKGGYQRSSELISAAKRADRVLDSLIKK